MNSHLNSEQLEQMLGGKADADTKEHVTHCAACTAEMISMRGLFGDLKESATEMAAAQRRIAVIPRTAPRAGIWVAAMAALVFAVAVPVMTHHPAAIGSPVIADAGVSGVTGGTNMSSVSDAQLMANIQNDLSSTVPEPMQALEGTDNNSSSTTGSK